MRKIASLRKIAFPARSRRKIGSEERKERPELSFRHKRQHKIKTRTAWHNSRICSDNLLTSLLVAQEGFVSSD